MPGTTLAVQNATCSVSAKKLVGIAVQYHATDHPQRDHLFRDELGSVEHVKLEFVGLPLGECLKAKLPLGEVALVDGIPEVPAMEVRIGAVDFDGLVPNDRLHAKLGPPVEFHEGGLALRR